MVATAAPAGATEAPPSFVLAWHDWDCESCGPFSGFSQFGNPTGIAVDPFGNVYVTDTANNRVDKFDGSGYLSWAWGSPGSGDGQFEGPTGVAVDGSAFVYVVDAGNDRIEKFDSNGDLLMSWGSQGWGDGEFQAPAGVAVDGSGGTVYVTDTTQHRVQAFSSSGTFLQAWGSEGSWDGAFESPAAIAVDPSGNVFVADTGNHRIQQFNSFGNFFQAWGSEGSGVGEFESPAGLAVDGSGNVFVSDTGNHRIQKFDDSGTFLSEWGSEGSADGQFEAPAGLATDSSGDVFVADANNARIQKFGPSSLELTVSTTGAGSGTVSTSPSGIDCGTVCSASFANGGLVELFATPDVGSAFANWGGDCGGSGRCVIPMTQTRSVSARFESGTALTVATDGPGAGSITSTPLGIDCGATCSASFVSGSTVTLHASPHSQSAFIGWSGDCSGTDDCVLTMGAARSVTATFGQSPPALLLAWGSFGSGEGQFSGPSGVAVDGSGHVFVVAGNNRVAKYDDNGQYVLTIGGYGTGNDQFAGPSGVAVDGSGNVFVADSLWPRIAKFDNDGHFLSQWSVAEMNGIAVDGSGNVFVTNNAGVAKFDNDGNFLMAWGSPGSGDGQFETATGIAIDAAGDVFVIDLGNDRIEKFDNGGNFLLAWGSLGSAYGQLNGPTGIAVDGSGNVFVTENGFRATINPFSRVQEFDGGGHFLSAWGSFGSGDGQFRYPSGVTVDSAGSVFVVDQGNARIEKFGHPTFDLTVSRDGSGSGTVATSEGSDINCGTTCSAPFASGSTVTLTETPDGGSVFAGWSTDCTIVNGDCHVTMDQARTVTATFVAVHSITVTTSGAGSGSVDPDTSGRSDCGSASVLCYETGRSVTLTAAPSPGSRFIGWGGDCSGTGDCTLSTDTDTAATATFELKIDQTITFASISKKTIAQSPLAINPIASSGLAVVVTSATPTVCEISQGKVVFSAPGTCSVRADQAGDDNYNPAPRVTRSFTITKANQKITFGSISKKTMLQSGLLINPTASSGLAVTVTTTTPEVCSVSQGIVVFNTPGTCSLSADQTGDTNYNPAPRVTRSFTITKANQKITFASISGKRMSQSGFAINPAASSGLAVTVTSTTPSVCVAQAMTIIFSAPGTCSLVAVQAGDGRYAPAPTVTRSFTIKP